MKKSEVLTTGEEVQGDGTVGSTTLISCTSKWRLVHQTIVQHRGPPASGSCTTSVEVSCSFRATQYLSQLQSAAQCTLCPLCPSSPSDLEREALRSHMPCRTKLIKDCLVQPHPHSHSRP